MSRSGGLCLQRSVYRSHPDGKYDFILPTRSWTLARPSSFSREDVRLDHSCHRLQALSWPSWLATTFPKPSAWFVPWDIKIVIGLLH